jgi:hypothetical protein
MRLPMATCIQPNPVTARWPLDTKQTSPPWSTTPEWDWPVLLKDGVVHFQA